MSTINFTENVSLNEIKDGELFMLDVAGVDLFNAVHDDGRLADWPATMVFQKHQYYDWESHRDSIPAISIHIVYHDNREKDDRKWQETLENEWKEEILATNFQVCSNYSSFFRYLFKSDKLATSQSKIFKVAQNLHILPGKMYLPR